MNKTNSNNTVVQAQSIVDVFQQAVDTYDNKVAYVNDNSTLTYREVEKLSAQFSAYLQTKLGIKKGQHIGLMCPNNLPFVVAMWGIIRAGGVQVNINPQYSHIELKHQLNDAEVDTIIIISTSTPVLAKIVEETPVKKIIIIEPFDLLKELNEDNKNSFKIDESLEITAYFTQVLTAGKSLSFIPPKLTLNDLLFLQYTGGTTGLSKGAMLSHGNLVANISQYEEHAKAFINKGEETVITAIPMYHIFALMVNTIAYFGFGAKNILITNPQNMANFVETWRAHNVTFTTGVNTLFNGLLHTPDFDDIDFSSLKLAVGGGAPVLDSVADKWKKVTGIALSEGYGLSETSPVLSLNIKQVDSTVTGIGVPLPSTIISLRDDNGKEVAKGEIGELCAKGPQVMQGYWKNEVATRDTMTADGFFKTGDIAMQDDNGFYHIVDRKKDMILVSGFNVFPNEIEGTISKMEGILECGCVGVEHDKTGEAVKVFVVKINADITENMIIDYCRERLSAYKVPKIITFVDQLPKSTVGKLLRRELVKM